MKTLRTSKFFGFCYADEIQECEFFAKNFKVLVQENSLVFSFDFMRGLDVLKIKPQLTLYRFFEIEDVYLRDKLIDTIKENSEIKKLSFKIDDYKAHIKSLKFTSNGFVIKLIA
ncbi:hypothetical protein AXE80_05195 [Wenyingzhuangia fucanilytica]|uniref:Uncharacterized protein n=1 Tax=Wenyingzhuangia fucanilytica TaxID=1790137 RepID=A0A1B1Y4P5_9FLAO|nr:hypothetical protein [Wenyingzhuangia fucanilytica]ANW95708.1 hypothetical protein AXE80_05195 [Wenyingzhuangia fucanilytica]